MEKDNLVIPNEYIVKWFDVSFIVAKHGFLGTTGTLDPAVREELFSVYYEGFDILKAKGEAIEIVVYNKPNLYRYLTEYSDKELVKQVPKQKQLKL